MSSFGANWDCPKTGDSDWYPMISTTHLFPVLLLLQVDLLLLITGRRYRRTLADHSLPLGRGGAFRDSRVRWVILVQVVVAFEPKGVLTLCFSFVLAPLPLAGPSGFAWARLPRLAPLGSPPSARPLARPPGSPLPPFRVPPSPGVWGWAPV